MRASFSTIPEWVVNEKAERAHLNYDWFFTVDGTDFWIPGKIYDIDGASIPWLFRKIPFIGKPFDKENLIAAGAHDPLFLSHALGFDGANEAARQLWIQSGKSPFAANAMKAAVSSPFGKLAYFNTAKDLEELALIRRQLKWRDDWQKFESLWFPPVPMKLIA